MKKVRTVLAFAFFVVGFACSSAEVALLDQPVTASSYDDLAQQIRGVRSKLTPQESLDLSIAVNYMESKEESMQKHGLFKQGYKLYLYEMLNGCSPRKTILIASGMMLAEWSGRTTGPDIDKTDYQLRNYLGKIRSYGEGFSRIYGKIEAPESDAVAPRPSS
jgi:hypothetical protein